MRHTDACRLAVFHALCWPDARASIEQVETLARLSSSCHSILDRCRSGAHLGCASTLRLPLQSLWQQLGACGLEQRPLQSAGPSASAGPRQRAMCQAHRGGDAPEMHACCSCEAPPAPPSCLARALQIPGATCRASPGLLTLNHPLKAPLAEPLPSLSAEGESTWAMPRLLLIFPTPLQALRRAPLHG